MPRIKTQTKNMRKAEFNVPQEVIVEFSDAMLKQHLSNEITGTTENGEVIVEVHFDKEESDEVDALETTLDELIEGLEEETEEEETED